MNPSLSVQERQTSDVEDQIVPLFVVTFFASLVSSVLRLNLIGSSSDGTNMNEILNRVK